MAAAFNKKPKATGILGWIEGLFGHKDQTAANADSSQSSQSSGAGRGGAGRTQALLAGLNLTADQQAKVKAIFADARTKATAAGADADARRGIMQNANQQVEAVLTPDQRTKFEAARAQARAAGAGQSAAPAAAPPAAAQSAAPPAVSPVSAAPHARHAQAQVAASGQPPAAPPANAGGPGGGRGHFLDSLGLSPAQQAQAQAIMAQARASQDPAARHAAMDKLQAILTPEQKAKFAAMRAARGAGPGGQ
jgi:Spy/CpxP family protein refolding chaperone